MAPDKKLMRRLKDVETSPRHIARGDWTWSAYTSADTGNTEEIASYRAGRALVLDDSRPVRVVIPRYEQITDASADGLADTISLSGDLINAPDSQTDIVYFADGAFQAQDDGISSLSYANDEFSHTDGGSSEELDVWYITPAPANLKIKKVAPASGGRVEQDVYETNAGLLNQRDQVDQESFMNVGRTPLHAFVPEDWQLKVELNAPFIVRNDDDGGRGAEALNMMLEIPVQKQTQRIDGLADAVKMDVLEGL